MKRYRVLAQRHDYAHWHTISELDDVDQMLAITRHVLERGLLCRVERFTVAVSALKAA